MGSIRSQYLPVIAFLSVLFSGSTFASLGVISLESLTEKADLIVYGKIERIDNSTIETETRESASKLPVTMATVRIAPIKIIKGIAVDPLIVIANTNMEDSPEFQQNHEVFLFLTQNKDNSSYSIIGLMQGKFDVSDGLVVREHMPVETFIKKLENVIQTL